MAAKHEASSKRLERRVASLEQKVSQLVPMSPEQQANTSQASEPDFYRENPAGRNQDVGVSDRLRALGGRSTNELARDDERGSASPLGHGKTKERRR